MKALLLRGWSRIRLAVIILLSLTIGISWTIAVPKYLEMKKEADWTYQRVQQLQEQKVEIKEVKDDGEMVQAISQVTPIEGMEEPKKLLHPSGIEEIIHKVAKQKNFKDPELLVRIAKSESGLQPCIKNPGSSARGIFQILDMHGLTVEERCNPEIATVWAIDKINAGGISAWASSKSKWSSM